MRHRSRNDTSDDRRRLRYDQDIKTQRARGAQLRLRIDRDVVERGHIAEVQEEVSDGEAPKGEILEGADVEGARSSRRSWLAGVVFSQGQHESGSDEERQHHEADAAHHPWESNFGEQLLDHEGVDDTAEGSAGGCDAEGESAFSHERATKEGEAGDVQQSKSKAHADSLAEEDLVVFARQTEHHDAEDGEYAAGDDHGAIVAQIKQRAGHEAAHNEQP